MGQKSAFTLTELMVVIAIIAILSVAAVPAYQSYMARAKIAKVLDYAFNLRDTIITNYQTHGQAPSTIDFNGLTLLNQNVYFNQVQAFNHEDISGLLYNGGLDTYLGGSTTQVFRIMVFMPNVANGFSNNQLRILFYDDGSGVIKTICGSGDPTYEAEVGGDIPIKYLPAACQCNRVENIYQGDAPFSAC